MKKSLTVDQLLSVVSIFKDSEIFIDFKIRKCPSQLLIIIQMHRTSKSNIQPQITHNCKVKL